MLFFKKKSKFFTDQFSGFTQQQPGFTWQSPGFIRATAGFTLIELLVVIAIIGLLSTIAVINMNFARARARDAIRMHDLSLIDKAIKLYDSENGHPPSTQEMDKGGWYDLNNLLSEYFGGNLPIDPLANSRGGVYIYCSDWDGPPNPVDPSKYLLAAALEQNTEIQNDLDDDSVNRYTPQECITSISDTRADERLDCRDSNYGAIQLYPPPHFGSKTILCLGYE